MKTFFQSGRHLKQSAMPLFLVLLFDHVSVNIALPVFTFVFFDAASRIFTGDASHAVRSILYGVCMAIPYVVGLVFAPLLSAISDSLGRKKVLFLCVFGALISSVITVFGILAGAISIVLMGRVVCGIFAKTNPIAQAIIGDISEPKNKMVYMGYVQFVIAAGAFLGPIIGGYYAKNVFFKELNFSFPYMLSAAFAFVGLILVVYLFKETNGRDVLKPDRYRTRDLLALLKNKKVVYISIMIALFQFTWSLYYQFIGPVVKSEFSFDTHEVGLFIGLIALWLALGSTFGVNFLNRFFSLQKILKISGYTVLVGLVLSMLPTLFPSMSHLRPLLWIGSVPIPVGDVIAYSCFTTLYSNAVGERDQGKVMAVCFFVVFAAWSLTALAGGFLMAISPRLPMLAAALGTVTFIVLMSTRRGKTLLN